MKMIQKILIYWKKDKWIYKNKMKKIESKKDKEFKIKDLWKKNLINFYNGEFF